MNGQEPSRTLRPVPPPEELEPNASEPHFVWLLLPVIVIALAMLIWFRRTRRTQLPVRAANGIVDELRRIISAKLDTDANCRKAHDDLANFLHRAICFYHRLDLIPRGTNEIVSQLSPEEHELIAVLQHCDRVRFGRLQPGQEETRSLIAQVEKWHASKGERHENRTEA